MKKYIVAILSALVVLALVACSNNKELPEPPEISITAGDIKIVCIACLSQLDGTVYDTENTFHGIMKEGSDTEIPYIQLGENFQIEFEGAVPDTYELEDYILNEKGDIKYKKAEAKAVPVEFIDGKGTFALDINWAASLSSYSGDYDPGKSIRGYRLTCSWGDDQCEYAFIIRTDAL